MTNVNPNLKTFSNMYQSGMQPVFTQIQPQGAPTAQLPGQPSSDVVVINKKNKLSKGKVLAFTGLAIAGAAAVAAVVTGIVNGKVPQEVREATKSAKKLVDGAKAMAQQADKMVQTTTDEVASAAGQVASAQTKAGEAANAVKAKLDEVTGIFDRNGCDASGNPVSGIKFFRVAPGKEDEVIDLANIAAAKNNGLIRMTFDNGTEEAAKELVETLFNGGKVQNVVTTAADGVQSSIEVTDKGVNFLKGIKHLGEGKLETAEAYVFDKIENNLPSGIKSCIFGEVSTNGILNSQKQVVDFNSGTVNLSNDLVYSEQGLQSYGNNFAFAQSGDTITPTAYFSNVKYNEEIGDFVTAKEVTFDQGKINSIVNNTNEDGVRTTSYLQLNNSGETPKVAVFEVNTNTEDVHAKTTLHYNGDGKPERIAGFSQTASKDGASVEITEAVNCSFGEDGKPIKYSHNICPQEADKETNISLEFNEDKTAHYERTLGGNVEQEYNYDLESKKWVDPAKAKKDDAPAPAPSADPLPDDGPDGGAGA